MSLNRVLLSALLASSALSALSVGGVAQAQQAAAPQMLGEVVVTASRREDTVHNIPMAISAVSNQDVERKGLKTANDLTKTVTALRISPANSGGAGGGVGNPDVAIRGVRSTTGAPTTGIYIDDVPLQQRTVSVGQTGGGVVFPNLFDLQRIEVLRGPQGTLYGGSSEGGTLRFITPSVSFTKKSLYMRGEVSKTEEGGTGYEYGVATGGPIIEDKLAARLSGTYRKDAGFLDHVSRFTGRTIAKDTNEAEHEGFQASIAWKPVERATVTLSYLYTKDSYDDTDNFWEDFPRYSANVGPGNPGTLYSYGPYSFGPYKTGQNTNIGDNYYTSDAQLKPLYSPHTAEMKIPSLTLDYAFPFMNVKSVTAYATTNNHAQPDFSYVDVISRATSPAGAIVPANPPNSFGSIEGPYNAQPNNSAFIASLPVYSAKYDQRSEVKNLTQELRFSSNSPESRLSWVGGFFYAETDLKGNATIVANLADLKVAVEQGRGQQTTPQLVYITPQTLKETQIAAYGEATYKLTEKLKATVGVRFTRDDFSYVASQGGALFGLPPTPVQVVNGSISESPITPKFGLQYVIDSNNNLYANAAKGFRPGGVNAQLAPVCQPALTAAGYPNGAPTTYDSDSLWSYEGGAKIRTWGGRASINASIFRIDWKDVQTPIALSCGSTFTVAKAQAVSQGADVQAQFRLFEGLIASVNVAYTDAKYTSTLRSSPTAILINDGDRVPFTPKWTANVTLQYDFKVAQRPTFVRADYQYSSDFTLGFGPGASSYSPDNYKLPGTSFVSARAGMTFDKFEVSAFVDNLTESTDLLARNGIASGPGRVSCGNLACTVFAKNAVGAVDATFRPRTFGVALSYRY